MYIGYPLTYVHNYRTLLENFRKLIGGLHPAFLKAAADGPWAGRYTDSSGARRRLQKSGRVGENVPLAAPVGVSLKESN